jgi:hypothetical protein
MPNVTIALKTLRMIDAMVASDQGSAYRGWLGKVMPHMGDAYRTGEEAHRTHMGASLLGGDCGRAIWYGFRWSTKPTFEGRILRLFNRGHLEEARFIAMLLMLGAQVFQQDAQGKQYRISFAEGHAGGSGDGVAIGVPDLPAGTPALCEFKTHAEKSFCELAGKLPEWRKYLAGTGEFTGKGVRDAKFEHYVQMQLYMRKMGIPAALYMAVNKNTDDIYGEIVPLNSELADQFVERGETLVWMDTPPEKINQSPGFFKCAWCDHKPVCHLRAAPDVNCRTCAFSEPIANAQWKCKNVVCEGVIPKELQLTGCSHYEMSRNYG